MPELPEVETVVRDLRAHGLEGAVVCGVDVRWPRTVGGNPAAFRRRLVGRTITGLARRAKHIVLALDSGDRLLIHLRMTGKFRFATPEERPAPHDRVVLSFGDGLPCPRCGTALARIVVGQRGTHFCPLCQQKESATCRLTARSRTEAAPKTATSKNHSATTDTETIAERSSDCTCVKTIPGKTKNTTRQKTTRGRLIRPFRLRRCRRIARRNVGEARRASRSRMRKAWENAGLSNLTFGVPSVFGRAPQAGWPCSARPSANR